MRRLAVITTLVLTVLSLAVPIDALAQRRGGSFGGSRGGGFGRSFGRSYRSPNGGRSFGGSRSYRQSSPPSQRYGMGGNRFGNAQSSRNSFGGSRMGRPADYTGRYGVPRSAQRQAFRDGSGRTTNYVVNRYGGMGDGFMMGYMMGSIPWYWSMPFHPAFYYSRPYTNVNPDGTVGVYPPTFQWSTLILTLLVVAGVSYILYTWLRNRRRIRGAFDGGSTWNEPPSDDSGSKSSFY